MRHATAMTAAMKARPCALACPMVMSFGAAKSATQERMAAAAAAAAGTVIYAGWTSGYGNIVVLDHGRGLSTAYGHNSRLLVGVGATVAQGAVIALSGNTGRSTGPHVHFEVRLGGTPVDPMRYL